MSVLADTLPPAADEAADGARSGPERRCIVTGEVGPKSGLVRCALRPVDGGPAELVPDIEGRLPGRGLWITARRDIVARAVAKNLFARAARGAVKVPDDLPDLIASLLARRCVDYLGMARRAGDAVAGFEQVRGWCQRGRVAALVEAQDAAPDGHRKIRGLAPGAPVIAVLTGAELGAAFGRDRAVHVALAPGRIAERFCAEARRLGGFRRPGAPALANSTD